MNKLLFKFNLNSGLITHSVTHRPPVANIKGQTVALTCFLSESLFICMYEMLLTGPAMWRHQEISA